MFLPSSDSLPGKAVKSLAATKAAAAPCCVGVVRAGPDAAEEEEDMKAAFMKISQCLFVCIIDATLIIFMKPRRRRARNARQTAE